MKKLRDALRRVVADLGRGTEYYNHEDVIKVVRSQRPDLIRSASSVLENMALKRILNDIESKQSKSFNIDQPDMFPELAGLPFSLKGATGDPKGARRLLHRMRISAIRAHLTRDLPPTQPRADLPSIEALFKSPEFVSCITSEDQTLEDVLIEYRKRKP